ncbi:hypothetical protein [Streptococcus cristatus]|uniref:hypothetical protein n=1 Tax=Streptococcus cristatus TaxID=45634 RepID=UPI000785563E|nr:hypothetical protein [Streptococcus cristatus]
MAFKETGRVFVIKEFIEEKAAGCGCVTITLLIGALLYTLPALFQSLFSLALTVLVIIGIVWLIKKFLSK